MVKFAPNALAKPSVEGPCRALHAEGYPLPECIPKMIGNGQICPESLLLCCRPRKGRFSRTSGGPPNGEPLRAQPERTLAIIGHELVIVGCQKQLLQEGYSRDALAKPSVEGPCRALHAEGYPVPERIPKMIGHEG